MMETKNIAIDRPSDVILKSLERLFQAKRTGAVTDTEFSDLIVKIGDLYANKIRLGKASMEEVDEVESYIECLLSKNKDNYFSNRHKDLEVAGKKFLEGDYVALQDQEKRQIQSQPIFQSYTKGLKKVA